MIKSYTISTSEEISFYSANKKGAEIGSLKNIQSIPSFYFVVLQAN
jgi:hypothetical protein